MSGKFLVPDLLILFLLSLCRKALPGEGAAEEVDEDEAEGLEVVSPRLLDAQMCVDRGVPRSTCEVLAVLVRDVFSRSGFSVPLGKSEINDVNIVLFLSDANQKVVRLDVSV